MAAAKKAKSKTTTKSSKKRVVKKKTGRSARKATKRKATKKKATKKKAARARKKKTEEAGSAVTFRSPAGEARLAGGSALQSFAMRWRYKLSKRDRWRTGGRLRQREELLADLTKLDTGKLLDWIALTDIVEVRVPYEKEATHWEARITPWEYVLSSVSRQLGRAGAFSVVRHLDQGVRAGVDPQRKIQKVMYVEACPGRLSDHFSFDRERADLRSLFPSAHFTELVSPTLQQLEDRVQEIGPDLIHVSGIDNHQARRILSSEDHLPDDWTETDGVVLSDGRGGMRPTETEAFARAVNAGENTPQMVYFNVYHSASRLAAMAVANGALYSVGFQDTIDDTLAETLMRVLYRNWALSEWRVLPGFLEVIRNLRQVPRKLTGTGVVLWSRHSLLDDEYDTVREDTEKLEMELAKELPLKRTMTTFGWSVPSRPARR